MSIKLDQACINRLSVNVTETPNVNYDFYVNGTAAVSSTVNLASQTASAAVVTDASKNLSTRAILNNTSKGALGWNSAGNTNANNLRFMTVNTLAYWNGEYADGKSNLAYYKDGAFGSMAKEDASVYAKLASPALTGTPIAPTAANGTSTTQIATTEFVNNTLSYVNAMRFKGTLGTGGTITALPASHEAGDTYRVITAGTWAGKYCEVGTLIICTTDGTAANDAHWTSVETNEDGAIIGPESSTDNAIARFDGATGRIIQNSKVTIDDNGCITLTHVNGKSKELSIQYGSTIDYWWGVGTANTNHGMFDVKADKWIISAGADNKWNFDGNANSATSANYIKLYEARSTTTTLNKAANYVAAGAMFHLVASSSTSGTDNGKTPTDANILQMNWDNSGGYDAQLGIATGANRMYFRSRPSQKVAWEEVAHAPVGTTGVGNATQPVYMTSDGVITAGTALKALAYEDSLTYSDVGAAASSHNHNANDINDGILNTARLPSDVVKTYSRNQIGTAPNFDSPGINGYFEIRNSSETTQESGLKPFNGFGNFLNLQTSVTRMQIAGTGTQWYIRGTQSGYIDTAMSTTQWNRIVLNSGSWDISITGSSASCTGNAATATAIQTAGTTAQFYRGDNSWSNIIKQTANAALGIGTTLKIGTAIKDLHFSVGSGSGTGINDGNAGGITIGTDTASYGGIYWQSSGSYGLRLHFATTGSFANGAYTRMLITHDGKVGIGTLNPDTLLTVNGNAHIAKIKIGNGTSDAQQRTITVTEDNNLIFDAPSSKGFIFQQNATTKIRIVGYTCYPETSTDSSLGITGKRWETAYLTTSLLVGANSTGVNYNTNGLISFIGPGVISSCVTSAGNGYYLIGGGTQYGRWYIKTIGTASNGTTQGAQGETVLEVGNNTPLTPNTATGGAHNSRGIIRIYGKNNYHTDILAQANGDNSCYLPNYDNDMFLVHAGSNDAIGSGKRPVYVASNGRVTVCNATVGDPYTPMYANAGEFTATSPVQYFTWSISSGKYGVSITDDDGGIFKDNTYNVTLVVLSGESNLNAPLTWTSGEGTFSISTAVAVSGDVTGYAIVARGTNITNSITFTQIDSNT